MTHSFPIGKVLVAVDGSQAASRAARMAADIAVRFGARLTLVYVVPPAHLPPEAMVAVDLTRLDQDHDAWAKEMLEETIAALEEPGVPTEPILLRGDPAQVIADTAGASGADLVVVGSHGRGALGRAFLGSVSTRLVHICQKTVLVVR